MKHEHLKEANMSDYRDPRDPVHRDPAYDGFSDRTARDMQAQAFSPGTAVAWFVGIALFIGVLIFAFGNSDTQVAETQTTPPATTSSPTTPATPPAATPPAQTPAPKQ
jgi:hypothetical protein